MGLCATLLADCLQLAGVVAVEVTGGPTIDFVPGRKVCNFRIKDRTNYRAASGLALSWVFAYRVD